VKSKVDFLSAILLCACVGIAAGRTDAVSMNALVLVNSDSFDANWGREYVIPYLEHFGVPYKVCDLAKKPLDPNIRQYSLLIAAQQQLTIKHSDIMEIDAAVESGCGLVSFSFVLPRLLANTVDVLCFPAKALDFNDVNHFITAQHKRAKFRLFSQMTLPGGQDVNGTVLIKGDGGQPLLIVTQRGRGRIVQWTGQAWMSPRVLGPLGGLDGCLWRSIVWAARKPFAMRSLPPLVTMRVDDVAGRGGLQKQSPFYWIKTCGKYGFKPWLGLFIYNLTPEAIEELRGYIKEGIATASPHALGRPPRPNENQDFYYNPKAIPLRYDTYDEFIYFKHDPNGGTAWSDEELAKGLKAVDDWYAETKLPMANYFVAHYYEAGRNAIPYVAEKWRMEFAAFNQQVGLPYGASSPWIKCGPFRLYENPGPSAAHGQSGVPRPVYYADFVDIDGHKFFNCITEIRDDAGYEWSPDNDVNATVGRGVRQLRRALDSKALAVLFTHETDYIYKIKPENWDKELKAIAEGIADYNPIYLTTDDALKIVRAYRTGRLQSCEFDVSSKTIKAELVGGTDVETLFYLYSEKDGKITSTMVKVPAFSGKSAVETHYK